MLFDIWHTVPDNESDNVLGSCFEGKVAIMKYCSFWGRGSLGQRLQVPKNNFGR